MATRCLLLLTVFACLSSPAWAQRRVLPGATQSPQERLGVSVPMRDGTKLAADVYLPTGAGRWPAILIRTPYSRKADGIKGYRWFTTKGYAVVMQDVRGRYASQGVLGAISQEGPDGNDTINWIAEQPWSNGRVGMAGSSYLGIVQWWAALQQNPHLATIVPAVSGDDEYHDRFYSSGGGMRLSHRAVWLSENLTPPYLLRPPFHSYIESLPLRHMDRAATGIPLQLWQSVVDHPSYDHYWQSLSVRQRLDRVTIPVLSFGGWYDAYAESDLDAFSRLSRYGRQVETWIGPWPHTFSTRFPTIDFGHDAQVPIRLKQLDWFDHWLKKSTVDGAPQRLHLFVMGRNEWREEQEWPLARTRYTSVYLDSNGHANSSAGDGELTWEKAFDSPSDEFVYDPRTPVPTSGGAICCNPVLVPPGPLDQQNVERRPDVLVYTSAPLDEPLEVTGSIKAELYVASSANDTDWTLKLVDVGPDGTAILISDGMQRMRYRLSLDKPVFARRNTPYQVIVSGGVTSWQFAPGHRVRIEISSSNFPKFDRNLNSLRPNADASIMSKAHQTVFHGTTYPSAVILPVIPLNLNEEQASIKPQKTHRAEIVFDQQHTKP